VTDFGETLKEIKRGADLRDLRKALTKCNLRIKAL